MYKKSKAEMIKQGLLLEKIIYAKRVQFDKKMLVKVIELEIANHIKIFPQLECIRIADPVKMEDRSMLYSIEFAPRKLSK